MRIRLNSKKRITIYNAIIFSIVIFISVFLGYVQSISKTMSDQTIANIEKQWRSQARNISSILSIRLENDINDNKLNYWDDDELRQWGVDNLLGIRNGGEKSDLMMVNLGFSHKKWDKDTWLKELSSLELKITEKNLNEIINYFTTKDYKGKSNNIIVNDVNNFINSMNINEHDKKLLINSIINNMFIKNRIIIDEKLNAKENNDYTSLVENDYMINESVDSVIKEMEHGYSTTDNSMFTWSTTEGDEWLEWSVVPSSRLGLDNEPESIYGNKNLSYKKIIIVVSTNKSEIMAPYNNIIQTQRNISNLCLIVTVISFIVAMILSTYNFYKFLTNDK